MIRDKKKLEQLASITAQRIYNISWKGDMRGADCQELKRLFRRSILAALKRATER